MLPLAASAGSRLMKASRVMASIQKALLLLVTEPGEIRILDGDGAVTGANLKEN